jgi:formylglycine-generating enzyme required for sulfatase activity
MGGGPSTVGGGSARLGTIARVCGGAFRRVAFAHLIAGGAAKAGFARGQPPCFHRLRVMRAEAHKRSGAGWPAARDRVRGGKGVVCLCAALSAACSATVLPHDPEVVVTVDTDVPVPDFADRLRVDTYSMAGDWIDSREAVADTPSDWPMSFSVVARGVGAPARALLRLRAYRADKVRSYLGERYEPRPTYTPPPTFTALDDLCAGATELRVPATVRVRTGTTTLTDLQSVLGTTCDPMPPLITKDIHVTLSTAGLRVHIQTADTYWFHILRLSGFDPSSDLSPVLALRTACNVPESQIACDHGTNVTNVGGSLPELRVHLDPGDYTLIVATSYGSLPLDLLVRGEIADPVPSGDGPRLMHNGVDVSPPTEPLPALAIDRLAVVDLQPETVNRQTIYLRGDCTGTVARLSEAGSFALPVLGEARTCVDTDGVLAPALEASDGSGGFERATFGRTREEDCAAAPSDASTVCVAGGMFLLGDANLLGDMWPLEATPERLALMSTFWLDRAEVTVGRFRAAVVAGTVSLGRGDPKDNSATLAPSSAGNQYQSCTWSVAPVPGQDREAFPINCISWSLAREFCKSHGGDLPTEAQWEYAASRAGRLRDTMYPHGNDDPGCEGVVYGRYDGHFGGGTISEFIHDVPGGLGSTCFDLLHLYGPAPAGTGTGDRTPSLGILDLGGGVSEYARDSMHPYDDACWRSQPLRDPLCWEENPVERAIRGGSWASRKYGLAAARRGRVRDRIPDPIYAGYYVAVPYLGFRCVYQAPPGRNP